jgi:hypothetical protein
MQNSPPFEGGVAARSRNVAKHPNPRRPAQRKGDSAQHQKLVCLSRVIIGS